MALISDYTTHSYDREYSAACARCKRAFTTINKNQKYCSHSCSNCASADRRFERRESTKTKNKQTPVDMFLFLLEVQNTLKVKGIPNTNPKEILKVFNEMFTLKYLKETKDE